MTSTRLQIPAAHPSGRRQRPEKWLRGSIWLAGMVLFWPVKAAFAVTGHMHTDPSVKDLETAMWRSACVVLFYAFYLIDICAVLEMV